MKIEKVCGRESLESDNDDGIDRINRRREDEEDLIESELVVGEQQELVRSAQRKESRN